MSGPNEVTGGCGGARSDATETGPAGLALAHSPTAGAAAHRTFLIVFFGFLLHNDPVLAIMLSGNQTFRKKKRWGLRTTRVGLQLSCYGDFHGTRPGRDRFDDSPHRWRR